MADQNFTTGFAIVIQTALGTPNIPAAWTTASVTEAAGLVLGDSEQGDAESGITFPEHVRVGREAARLGRTAAFDSFLRQDFEGLQIGYLRRGNGVTSTPSVGQAVPPVGIDALNRALGLVRANGGAPEVTYTPGTGVEYATVCVWVGDRRFIYQDCIVASRTETYTPGDAIVVVDSISIGSLNAQADGVAIPAFNYGTQATLSAPVIQGTANTFNTLRGFEECEITIEAADQEQVGDSNQPTGKRQIVGGLDVTAELRLYLDGADSDFEYDALVSTVAPATPWFFQVGSAAGVGQVLNACESRMATPRVEKRKEDRTGSVVVLPLTLRARAATTGTEYKLTYN